MPLQAGVTELLVDWKNGSQAALDELLPLVYDEMRRLAASYLGRERSDHTLQPTALVHEAYIRLVGQREIDWQNRAQFFGLAAEMMRRILVNHARDRNTAKRGGGHKVSLDEAVSFFAQQDVELVALDEALTRLAVIDKEQSRIVELRFFGGLSIEEAAEVLSISPSTVKREWMLAKAWLHREISRGDKG
jgi:RNA polymerase sigma factor (TIGR02999 family)